jgi:V/A-type H+/Na+-transporting ATPase subunit A
MDNNVIHTINGPVVSVNGASGFSMLDMVYVGHDRLLGEVIAISKTTTTIQVYESTTGLKPGEPVTGTGEPISAELGPGLVGHIFDGIGRPLEAIASSSGMFIPKGSDIRSVDPDRSFETKVVVKEGDMLKAGDVYATTMESASVLHRMMVPEGMSGTVVNVRADGPCKADDIVVTLKDGHHAHELSMVQKWPIKKPRPVRSRLGNSVPLISGQRVIDTLFPIAKGGTAAVPGGFGTGKTMMQHQFAKWCDADLIVYVGCGERGNEMTQVLEEFKDLIDPRTNKPLMDRTVLIANTSNMPVAAREASIYTGVTIAEYYRDMGYHVALMADSTSRWAEALREISGRLEEMPAEEGFPAYLPSRISQFYERAGHVTTLNGTDGSVTIIGAVSPQGADFSEPVTQNTKRFVRCFWALDKELAYARHYAAINWNQSYSEYLDDLHEWYDNEVGPQFLQNRSRIRTLLAEETKLLEIAKLIGSDVLPDDQRLVIETGRVIRLGFLQQNAFHKEDTYVPLEKQLLMMDAILRLYDRAKETIESGRSLNVIVETGIFDKIIKMKYDIPNDRPDMFKAVMKDIDKTIGQTR